MYLTDEQRKRLAQRAKDAGTSEAAVVRQILDEALGIDDGRDELLEAIRATAGIWKDYKELPDYLRQIRGRGADARLKELGL